MKNAGFINVESVGAKDLRDAGHGRKTCEA